MAKHNVLLKRLQSNIQVFRFIFRLNTHYNLSLVTSELFSREMPHKLSNSLKETLQNGHIWYSAVHKDEPAGKSLSNCSKVRVKLTLIISSLFLANQALNMKKN